MLFFSITLYQFLGENIWRYALTALRNTAQQLLDFPKLFMYCILEIPAHAVPFYRDYKNALVLAVQYWYYRYQQSPPAIASVSDRVWVSLLHWFNYHYEWA